MCPASPVTLTVTPLYRAYQAFRPFPGSARSARARHHCLSLWLRSQSASMRLRARVKRVRARAGRGRGCAAGRREHFAVLAPKHVTSAHGAPAPGAHYLLSLALTQSEPLRL